MSAADPPATTTAPLPQRRKAPTLIGSVIGNYRVERELGRGGMGVVYEARHVHMDRVVAIKALLPSIANDEETLQRLFREQQILDGLRHANIVALHDVQVQEDGVFLVMELIEGVTLEDRVKTSGALSPQVVAAVGQQLLSALAHTHTRGVVHRDIKPGNIMLTRSEAKLLDFGIARAADSSRLTAPDMVFGSPAYLPPELWAGKEATPASDLYALALCLYEALAGEPALRSGSGWQAYYALHTTSDIPRVDGLLPPSFAWLAEAIHRATRRDPRERYADAKEMLAVFRDHQGLSGEISLAALALELSGAQAQADGPVPQALRPSEDRTLRDSGPTLVRTTAALVPPPRRSLRPVAIALASGLVTTALVLALTRSEPVDPPSTTAPVAVAEATATPPPATATPTEPIPVPSTAGPTPASGPKTPSPVAIARTEPEPAAEPEPVAEPAPVAAAETASEAEPCGERGDLETRAAAGRLTPVDVSCVASALAASERQTEQDRLSRYLLVDARARGDLTTWTGLALHHLTHITQSDPVLCFQYASQMRKERSHVETIRWADRALENKQDFPDDKHAGWVSSLLQLRAMAAHDRWSEAESRYTEQRLTKDRNDADRARVDARTHAKEWYDFASEAGTDVDRARKICHTVAGTTALCP